MPIYEYQCESCGHKLEKLQKVSDDLLKDCPDCNEPRLTKLVSAAGFRLKGGGWYETDFKSGSRRNVVENDSASASSTADTSNTTSSGGEGESKSDSKGDSKSDSNTKSVPAAAG